MKIHISNRLRIDPNAFESNKETHQLGYVFTIERVKDENRSSCIDIEFIKDEEKQGVLETYLKEGGFAKSGDNVVIMAGTSKLEGGTNMLRLHQISWKGCPSETDKK